MEEKKIENRLVQKEKFRKNTQAKNVPYKQKLLWIFANSYSNQRVIRY